MNVARRTQSTITKLEGTTEWISNRLDEITKGIIDGAGICEDEIYRATFESEQFDEEFDKSVSRFERRLESKTSWLLGQKNL